MIEAYKQTIDDLLIELSNSPWYAFSYNTYLQEQIAYYEKLLKEENNNV